MTFLIERLVELRRHLDHLYALRPRVGSAADLERDLSLHNDVLFSLLTVCQRVIDVAGELSARRGDRFEDYTEAVHNPAAMRAFLPKWWPNSRAFPAFATSSSTSTSNSIWGGQWTP